MKGTAHSDKVGAGQGIADAQNRSEFSLANGESVSIDLKRSARYFKLSADPGYAIVQSTAN
jgi:TPR repeat protein